MLKNNPCTKASKSFNKGDYNTSLRLVKLCIKHLKKSLRDTNSSRETIYLQLARASRLEGQAFFSINKSGKAISSLQAAKKYLQDISKTDDTRHLLAQINYTMGIILIIAKKYEEGISRIAESKDLYIGIKAYDLVTDMLSKLAEFNLDITNLNSSKIYYDEMIKYAKKIKDKKSRGIQTANALLGISRINRINGDEVEATNNLQKSKKHFQKSKYYEGLCMVNTELAAIHEIHNPDRSEELLIEALDLAKIADSDKLVGMVLTKLGILTLKIGKFRKGKARLMEGLKYRTKAGDKLGSAQILTELSRITLLTSRDDVDLINARRLIDQAIDLYESNMTMGLAMSLELASSINTKLNNFGLATKHTQAGLKVFREFNDSNGEGRMLIQLGIIFDLQNKPETVDVLKKAIKIFNKNKNPIGMAESKQLLGIHYSKSNPTQGIKYLKESRELYEKSIDNDNLKPLLQMLDAKIKELEEIN